MATEEELIEKEEECEEHHHHHHHDDEECCCEHDHEHHHHHHDDDDDDNDCCCEHDHEHHHHHHDDDEECECGHEHHHHHHHEHGEDCDCEDCVSGVSINHHDTALAGSFSVETAKTKEELDEILRTSMEEVGKLVDEHEGVIGHIKAALICGEEAAMYSLTWDEVSRVGEFETLGQPEKVSFAAIVYGVDDHELRELLIQIKEKIA